MSRPATEKQIAYAKKLGLNFPENISMDEISQLIDRKQSDNEPAPEWLINYLKRFNMYPTKYLGRRNGYEWMWNHLKHSGDEIELGIWFAYHVARQEMNNAWDDPGECRISYQRIKEISQQLISDQKVLNSIKRYEGWELDGFGEKKNRDGSYSTGGSKRTMAYTAAKNLINPSTGKKSARSNKKVESKSGCLGVFIGIVILIGVGVSLVI